MSAEVTIHDLAREAYDAFERHQRGEDEIIVLKDDAPQWVQDAVRDAHGEFLPDDWRYKSIRSAFGYVHDANDDDLDDMSVEWSDGNVDIYSASRTAWLASNLNRAAYCDEAAEDFGTCGGIMTIIARGQYVESRDIFYAVQTALENELERRCDDKDDS